MPAHGKKIERVITYTLGQKIGEGSYGKVYKARQKYPERWVVVKQLRNAKASIKNLKREAWIQGNLSHPYIVSVYDFDESEGIMIMEYVETSLDTCLSSYKKSGKWIAEEKALTVITKCLEALSYAHEHGVVHGDIKPKNILVSQDLSQVKLSDFGVAKSYTTSPHVEPGSESWAAPETLRTWEESKVWSGDYQSDLFEIGVVAYMLLSGVHPFADPSLTSKAQELILDVQFSVKPLGELKPNLAKYSNAIMKLLERDKQRRYVSAREALNDLSAEPQISCPNCSEQNPTDANYCNSCGMSLKRTVVGPVQSSTTPAPVSIARTAAELVTLAFDLNSNQDYLESIEACDKAIELDPQFVSAYHTRGFARSNLGDFKGAVADFGKALALADPFNFRKRGQILYQRGYAYMRMEKRKEACEDAMKALSFDPTNSKYQWLVSQVCKE